MLCQWSRLAGASAAIEEASDHCKITVFVISDLQKDKEGDGGLHTILWFTGGELYKWKDLSCHMEHSILSEKYIFLFPPRPK